MPYFSQKIEVFEIEIINFTIRKMYSIQWNTLCLFDNENIIIISTFICNCFFHSWTTNWNVFSSIIMSHFNMSLYNFSLDFELQNKHVCLNTKVILTLHFDVFSNCFFYKCWTTKQVHIHDIFSFHLNLVFLLILNFRTHTIHIF